MIRKTCRTMQAATRQYVVVLFHPSRTKDLLTSQSRTTLTIILKRDRCHLDYLLANGRA